MNRRSVAIVWLFAITLITGSCAITFYTAKLSLDSQPSRKILTLIHKRTCAECALKELSIFEDVIYAATIKPKLISF